MSAGSIPYHLRPNKAVDRFLFLELCSKLSFSIGKDFAKYIGFGGPQMEDFRLLHERFPDLPMLCIEVESTVIPRQQFNRPHTLVEFLDQAMSGGEWLNDWQPESPVLLWFDYAIKKERPEQFVEFQSILEKAPLNSVVRITMNADLPKGSAKSIQSQYDSLDATMGDLVPEWVDAEHMVAAEFPKVLAGMLEMAAEQVLDPKRIFSPLLLTTYRDTNQMLTVTGVLAERAEVTTITSQLDWKYLPKDWTDIKWITMPELTLKERITIDQMLPCRLEPSELQERLGFLVDESEDMSLKKLSNYREFYRHFPHFGRISV